MKTNIIHRKKTIATYLARQEKQAYQELLKTIQLAKQQGYTAQTHMLEVEADNYLQQQYKGAQIRTKLYINANETPTKQFFLTIEQNVQQHRQSKEIKSLHGQMHTEQKDICNSFKEFYETLYRSELTCPHTQNINYS